VIARTFAFAFKGRNQDVRRIAEALGVDNLLEGGVRQECNRVRITTQLVAASDGSHLWSGRYEREMTEILATQDEISQVIAEALRMKLVNSSPRGPAPSTFPVGSQNLACRSLDFVNEGY
jgi:TolB-like protein